MNQAFRPIHQAIAGLSVPVLRRMERIHLGTHPCEHVGDRRIWEADEVVMLLLISFFVSRRYTDAPQLCEEPNEQATRIKNPPVGGLNGVLKVGLGFLSEQLENLLRLLVGQCKHACSRRLQDLHTGQLARFVRKVCISD